MNADLLDSVIATHLPAAAGGDQAAYGRIVANCQGMVTSIALAIVRDVPASEDIAQDAFLSAWQNLRKLGNPQSFLPWLRQITRNLARDHLRAQRYRANPDGDVEALIAAVADPLPGPQETLAERQDARIAAEVIDALPEDTRETLLLYYREGQSSKQVAALLGVHDAAVRKRLSRARQQVREELLARLGEFSRASAPGVAFTAAVLTATTLASPPAAAATALVAGTAIAGKGVAKTLLGSLGSIGIGIAGALAGVWWGLRKYLRDPFDAIERRSLLRYGTTMSVLVIAFTIGLVLSGSQPGWGLPALICVLYVIGAVALVSGWMPRILARRHAEEARLDPLTAAARRREEGRASLAGGLQASTSQLRLNARGLRGRIDAGTSAARERLGGATFKYLREPFDAREQRGLRRYAVAAAALLAAFVLGLAPTSDQPGWLVPVLLTALYGVGVMVMAMVWMPRILARRHAHESQVDPVAAAVKRRREKLQAWIGCCLGLSLGLGGLIAGLILSGRL